MKIILACICIACSCSVASAQYWQGYGGYYRPPPSCGYYACYVHQRPVYQPRYGYAPPRPPVRRYQWYGGPPRAYLGGRGGGWGGEW
jgi:hypothetical protein